MVSESNHQQAVIKWSKQPTVRERYPELALLHHIKNETKEGAAQVAVDKAMGVKKGVPDLHLPVARGGYHSLYIEMKNETGRANDAQNWWLERLKLEGIVIDPERCPDTTREFTEYEYERDEKTGEVLQGYPDAANHHIDAVRYGTNKIWKRRGR